MGVCCSTARTRRIRHSVHSDAVIIRTWSPNQKKIMSYRVSLPFHGSERRYCEKKLLKKSRIEKDCSRRTYARCAETTPSLGSRCRGSRRIMALHGAFQRGAQVVSEKFQELYLVVVPRAAPRAEERSNKAARRLRCSREKCLTDLRRSKSGCGLASPFPGESGGDASGCSYSSTSYHLKAQSARQQIVAVCVYGCLRHRRRKQPRAQFADCSTAQRKPPPMHARTQRD